MRVVMAQIGEAAAAGAAVDMSDLLGSFVNDLGCRAVMGKSFRSEGRNKLLRQLLSDTSPLLAGFNVEEFFPFLARFGVLSKVVRAKSERLKRRWDHLLDKLIQDHERDNSDPKDKDADFIHVLLSVRHEYGLSRQQMKGILLVSIYILAAIKLQTPSHLPSLDVLFLDLLSVLLCAGRIFRRNRDVVFGAGLHHVGAHAEAASDEEASSRGGQQRPRGTRSRERS